MKGMDFAGHVIAVEIGLKDDDVGWSSGNRVRVLQRPGFARLGFDILKVAVQPGPRFVVEFLGRGVVVLVIAGIQREPGRRLGALKRQQAHRHLVAQ